MRRTAPRLAMLVVAASSTAAAQPAPAGETQVLTFAVTAPPPPPPLLVSPATDATDLAPPRGSWVVSETRSPVDYAPVAIATSVAATDDAPRLSIQCRAGQTEVLVLLAAATTGRESVTVAIDDEPPRPLRVGPSTTQAGLVLRDAPQRFLAGLPPLGTLRLRVAAGGQAETESRIALPTLATVLNRLAGPCAWSTTSK